MRYHTYEYTNMYKHLQTSRNTNSYNEEDMNKAFLHACISIIPIISIVSSAAALANWLSRLALLSGAKLPHRSAPI